MKQLEGVRLELTKLIWKKWQYIWCLIKDKLNERFYTISNEYEWKIFYYIEPLDLPYSRYQFQIESEFETIGHPATLSDFHRWMNERFWNSKYKKSFEQDSNSIEIAISDEKICWAIILYDSSKDFLEQSDEVLIKIRDLILSNK